MARFNSPTRILAVLPAILAGSCQCGPSDPSDPPADFTGELWPSEAHALPGAPVTFEIHLKEDNGHPVPVEWVEHVAVEWSTTPTGLSVAPDGRWAVVTAPMGSASVQVEAHLTPLPGAASLYDDLDLTVTGLLDTRPALPSSDALSSDVVRMDGKQDARLLIQGRKGTNDVVDRAVAVSGGFDLGADLGPRPEGSGSRSEVVAFAVGREAFSKGVRDADAWTAGVFDDVDADPMEDLEFSFRALPVWLGIPPDGTLTHDAVTEHLDTAQMLLDSARAGIRLDLAHTTEFVHGLVDEGGNSDVVSPSQACSAATMNKALTAPVPPGHEVDAGPANLYVLFVASIEPGVNRRGWTCDLSPDVDPPAEDWVGRVILISVANFSRATLAHEIAHVLGLSEENGELDSSHPKPWDAGFDEFNLLWSSTNFAEVRHHLTLGQLYRMNFDEASWLNSEILDEADAIERDCQSSLSSGICPALAAHSPPGG